MMVELLAPAGSYEGLMQNLEYGADAVYVGGAAFGARAYAKNLSQEELLQAIDEAHMRSKKVYLTVNTLLKNTELYGKLYEYLLPYYEQGLDAVIVQDYGVMQFIQREFPGMHIHASTQMTVTGAGGAAFLENCGVNRVVTARELSLEEIYEIHKATSLEIESFVHGALCYSYSGQCLFSSILGGRSGNRGRCAQPCRLPYRVTRDQISLTGRKEICPLSLKDMSTIDILPQIIEAGVTSLKIEGRMKQPAYAAGVVNIYRKYLDLYQENSNKYRVEECDRKELQALFNRGGFCKGYYEIRNGKEMMAFHNEKKTGDSLRNLIKKKEKVKGNLILSAGERAILELEYSGIKVQIQGDVVQEAVKQPLSIQRVREQMRKTGGTPYEMERLEISARGNVFLPMGSLNQLRRTAFETLQEKLAANARRVIRQERPAKAEGQRAKRVSDPIFVAACETKEQAQALLNVSDIRGIYCRWDFACDILEAISRKSTERNDANVQPQEIYMALPYVIRRGDMERLAAVISKAMELGCAGILVRNLESAFWLMEHGYGEYCILDSGVYTFNNESVQFWRQKNIKRLSAPLELNGRELRFRDNENSEMMVYGYLPMMISAQCIQKNLDKCRRNQDVLTLKDRYSKEFKVKCYCDFCYNVIYNSLPYGLLKEAEEVKELGFLYLRLSFTLESPGEVRRIAEDFLECYKGCKVTPNKHYTLTKGHFKRGVE